MQASLLLLLLAGEPALAEIEAIPRGFLEFLGSIVEQDGEWVDPLTLQTGDAVAIEHSETINAAPETVQKDDAEKVSEDGDSDE